MKLISFIDDLKVWDRFYYVNLEFFKKSRENSHVDFYEIEVTKVTQRTLYVIQSTVCWIKRPQITKLAKRELVLQDMEDDYAGGYKRTKEQAMFFLKEYKMFIENNAQSEDSEEPIALENDLKEHCLSILNEAIDVIEGKYIIW